MSQGAFITPAQPLTGPDFVTFLNAALAALASQSSGSAAPTLGPGGSAALVKGQFWLDTSASPNILRQYDGTSTWIGFVKFDQAGHTALPVNLPTPTSATDAASKGYVDSVAAGLSLRSSVAWATAAVLPNTPTYANGASGVGATLTAGSNAAIVVDGGSPLLNDRVLVQNQASAFQNGIYTVTTVGSGAAPWVLTRATDANQASNIIAGIYVFCEEGTVNTGAGFVLTTIAAITVGTTSLTFTQFNGPASSLPSGTPMLGSLLATNIAAPATPASGKTSVFVDSTNKILTAKNDAGASSMTVFGSSAPTHQFATGMSAGALTYAQPAASDLSNGVTGSGAVVLANTPTLITPVLGVASATRITFANGIGNGIILSAAGGPGGTDASVVMGAGGSVLFALGSVADGFAVQDHGSNNMLLIQEGTPGTQSTTTTQIWGNITAQKGTAIPAGGTQDVGYLFSSTAHFGIFFGSGVPTLSAAQGSLYVRSDGSSTSTRLYVNTNGTTGWTNVTTAT